ncbi:MAG: TolB-like 6-bladed beta-propeller domain-containing protein [Tannerella sp.]|jgi:hypothetical protein|nr:TolB-like 6-bladed beta-propeller domain-containing protein [Tannerella sp.]
MKRKIFSAAMIVAIAFLSGCRAKKSSDGNATVICFDREQAAQHVALHDSEEIVFEDLLNPAVFRVMYDTLVVVQNQPNCDHLLEIYSLPGKSRIAQFAAKGGGPEDFLSCDCYVYSGADSLIYAIDRQKTICYVVSLPSSLATGRLEYRKRFRYDAEVHPYSDILVVDGEHYVGYGLWYLNSKKYSNHVPALKRYTMEAPDNQSAPNNIDMGQHDYFVASVNDARLAINPSTKEIWLLDGHQDKIDIYNDSLQIIRTLSGPDGYQLSYTDVQSNIPIPFVMFTNSKTFRSYTDYTFTDKYLYVIYEGINGTDYNREDLQPVEILKFDLQGHLVCTYRADRFLISISVDSKEEYLYGTARTSVMEEAHFVKYKL